MRAAITLRNRLFPCPRPIVTLLAQGLHCVLVGDVRRLIPVSPTMKGFRMSAFSRMVADAFKGDKPAGARTYRVTTTEGHKFKTAPVLDAVKTAHDLADAMETLPSVLVKAPKDGASVNVGGGYNVQGDGIILSGAAVAESIRADYAVEIAARLAPPAGGSHVVAPEMVLSAPPGASAALVDAIERNNAKVNSKTEKNGSRVKV